MKEWMDEDEAAEWTGVPPADLKKAVRRGDIPVLRIGNTVRISRSALIALAGRPSAEVSETIPLPVDRTPHAADAVSGVTAPGGLEWRTPLATADALKQPWPQRGGGSYIEHYPRAWAGTIHLAGTDIA